ncbi:hypothetical protein K435DRAFT_399232 [Dendrothele bispora CBS 962.96]|uniref:Uncharacterized protein n=1 Tax=Dendrothele bispora (strain CBS 962.96) TaxID=1314807 RepID=A0A4S8MFS9_DENBC|nr:hypothetical protein K435DRAFT_399232 [Dendrothele bispora CBS 962.96]
MVHPLDNVHPCLSTLIPSLQASICQSFQTLPLVPTQTGHSFCGVGVFITTAELYTR